MPPYPRPLDLGWLVLACLAATAAVLPSGLSTPHPPRPRETKEAIQRVFADAVDADARRAVAGDFNGDGSEDLAVVARPAKGGLDRVNHELANWTLQDALAPPHGPPPRVTLAVGDVVLAVIHGHGADGWRNPEARQAYLVRNAAGGGLAVRTMGDAARELSGTAAAALRGDVIAASLGGRPGFLYWSGARYVWAARNAATPAP